MHVAGYATVDTLIRVTSTLLDKPGGYLRNDVLPPGVWLDNIPSWEYGVLVQVRDLAKVLRNDYSRSQSQSIEDPDLALGRAAAQLRQRFLDPAEHGGRVRAARSTISRAIARA